jgi:hypothetical protein
MQVSKMFCRRDSEENLGVDLKLDLHGVNICHPRQILQRERERKDTSGGFGSRAAQMWPSPK